MTKEVILNPRLKKAKEKNDKLFESITKDEMDKYIKAIQETKTFLDLKPTLRYSVLAQQKSGIEVERFIFISDHYQKLKEQFKL